MYLWHAIALAIAWSTSPSSATPILAVTTAYSIEYAVVTANIGVADDGDVDHAMAKAMACHRYMPKKPTKWGFKVIAV